jgi:radical SAM protein with 4Fe4S-binding SPASM domain
MCGRRKREREDPSIKDTYGFMDFELLEKIAPQIPKNILIQFHNNGCPLEYPMLGEALELFPNNIRCFNTKGGPLLVEKADEIIDNLDVLTLSIIPNDPHETEDLKHIMDFLKIKGVRPPRIVFRILGDVSERRRRIFKELSGLTAYRVLHSPDGSFNYARKTVIPEHGICSDMLSHPAIDRHGNLSICVRFDTNGQGILGNLKDNTLEELWNSNKRKRWLRHHIKGNRALVPLCRKCEFWGIPKG